MLRGMVTSLVLSEQITTTVAKAKEVRPLVEKYVTLARVDTLHNRRQALSYIFDKKAVAKLFAELGPRFKNRAGGYTRIIKAHTRPGDAAAMAVIEFVEKGAVNASPQSTDTDGTKKAKKASEPKAKKTTKKAAASTDSKEDAPKKKTTRKTSKKSEKAE